MPLVIMYKYRKYRSTCIMFGFQISVTGDIVMACALSATVQQGEEGPIGLDL